MYFLHWQSNVGSIGFLKVSNITIFVYHKAGFSIRIAKPEEVENVQCMPKARFPMAEDTSKILKFGCLGMYFLHSGA